MRDDGHGGCGGGGGEVRRGAEVLGRVARILLWRVRRAEWRRVVLLLLLLGLVSRCSVRAVRLLHAVKCRQPTTLAGAAASLCCLCCVAYGAARQPVTTS